MLLVSIGLNEIIVISMVIGMFALFVFLINKKEKPATHKKLPEPPKQPIPEPIKTEPELATTEPKKETIKSSYILSYHEQAMFKLLKEALPNHHIFVQVSFSAILWTPTQATRNRFNRKIADFVITCENFLIVAIVELDDVSHIGKEDKDRERDGFLTTAGYKVIHYKQLPTIEQIKHDII